MNIQAAIEAPLLTWAAAQSPPIPVAIENKAFTKPATGPYLKLFLLGAVTVNPDVSAEKERTTGIFQIDVCTPQGVGTKLEQTLVAAIKALYPVLPKTPPVSIERPASEATGRNSDDGFRVKYVSFSYRTIAG
jgi:hypothetical protein